MLLTTQSRVCRDVAPRLDVLLVDDDHNDRTLFGVAVDKANLNIWLQSVEDGLDAIEYLEGRNGFADRSLHPLPGIVVLDLDMRLSGGLDFLDWRRASESFSALPVVVFSGFAYRGAIDTALSMGANAFIAKPLEFDDWKAVVHQVWDFAMNAAIHT
jgi:CheY-like chemotaxis protein